LEFFPGIFGKSCILGDLKKKVAGMEKPRKRSGICKDGIKDQIPKMSI
jgi:hypothetical protein